MIVNNLFSLLLVMKKEFIFFIKEPMLSSIKIMSKLLKFTMIILILKVLANYSSITIVNVVNIYNIYPLYLKLKCLVYSLCLIYCESKS